MKIAKTEFLSHAADDSRRPQALLRVNVINSLINPHDTDHVVPSSTLCQNFMRYFTNTVSVLSLLSIRSMSDPSVPPLCSAVFQQFQPVSFPICLTTATSCKPPPGRYSCSLFKGVSNTAGSSILTLVHSSLSTGCVPSAFKHAVMQPLLKRERSRPFSSFQF